MALSFGMGFFKGTGSAKFVCGKSNNSQRTLENRLLSSPLNQRQKSKYFEPKKHLICFLKNQHGLYGHRLIRTKDITLYPESETLIVSLVYEPDTGYLRAVYEQAKT